ncbi:MAG: DNA integrity scanning protein DisA [Tenericutes bacterium ADurb.Bin239]|nr:MAG: DNA integrity scanning protein DisA [Tenericutes bacterium ADurb.Bin239]
MFLLLSDLLNDTQVHIIQLVVVFLFIVGLDTLLLITLKRIFPKVTLIVLSVILLVLGLFDLTYAFYLVALIYMLSAMTFIFGNIVEYRWLISNTATPKDRRFRRDFRKIFDQEDLVNQLVSAVFSLSKTKTGALITIERSNQLTEMIKNGSPINAPVSAPLLTTIFYKGTALHDGAVVIRDDTILAASVYFTPSTRALAGKVGSRHRAALGISEISDAVTIVVSEETGRISIAYRSSLQPVSPEDFRKVLVDYLFAK